MLYHRCDENVWRFSENRQVSQTFFSLKYCTFHLFVLSLQANRKVVMVNAKKSCKNQNGINFDEDGKQKRISSERTF